MGPEDNYGILGQSAQDIYGHYYIDDNQQFIPTPPSKFELRTFLAIVAFILCNFCTVHKSDSVAKTSAQAILPVSIPAATTEADKPSTDYMDEERVWH